MPFCPEGTLKKYISSSNELFFTKKNLILKNRRTVGALDKNIYRKMKNKKILQLKRGLYVDAKAYLEETEKTKLIELISAKLCSPSYISLEYALNKYHLLFYAGIITAITTKTNRHFKNFAGNFKYFNLKKSLFCGFEEFMFNGQKYKMATKAKALFDYLYLKSDLHYRNLKKLKRQLFEKSGICWNNFSQEDFRKFDKYVWQSNSAKMMRVWEIINNYFQGKKFDSWAKELLS